MSAAFVQAKAGQTGNGPSASVTLTGVVAGNTIAASTASFSSTPSIATSTPTGSWANAVANLSFDSTVWLRADYTQNVSSGSWTVNGNISPNNTVTVSAVEVSGVPSTGVLGVTGTGTSSATTTCSLSSAVTPTAGSCLLTWQTEVSAGGNSSANTITSSGNTPFTVDTNGSAWLTSNIVLGLAYFSNAAASSTNVTWTSTHPGANAMGICLIELVAGAATPAATLPLPPRRWDPWRIAEWWAAFRFTLKGLVRAYA